MGRRMFAGPRHRRDASSIHDLRANMAHIIKEVFPRARVVVSAHKGSLTIKAASDDDAKLFALLKGYASVIVCNDEDNRSSFTFKFMQHVGLFRALEDRISQERPSFGL